jgi:hypothetical protein
MHVGTNKSLLDLKNLDNTFAESVYLHEYVHYIQDLSCTYGLFNLHVIAEYMRMANNQIIAKSPGTFTVPVQPLKAGPDNVDTHLILSETFGGTGDDDEVKLVDHRIRKEIITTHLSSISIEVVELEYEDSRGSRNTFDFGELCISENMAFIVESECYEECEDSPQIPYHSAELLVNLIYPDFGKDRLNILALCDLSLLTANPGLYFYRKLLEFENAKIPFTKPEDIYEHCYNNPPLFNVSGGVRTFNQHLDFWKGFGQFDITSYLKDSIFDDINTWLGDSVVNAIEFRKANRSFVLDIARGGRIKDNNPLKAYINKVGTPLITNESRETSLYNPSTSKRLNYPLIWAIEQTFSVFWGSQRKCDMKNLCAQNGIKTDSRCDNEPWLRCTDKQLCSFGTVWHHWKLTGYYPK